MKSFPIDRGAVETEFLRAKKIIVGIDEVGRGCIAGPVFACAYIFDYEKLFALSTEELSLIRDSKTLTRPQRQSLISLLDQLAVQYSISSSTVAEIEELGIVGANFRAMKRALDDLDNPYDIVLLDGNQRNPLITCEQITIVKGDMKVYAIAAASILAKEARDAFMIEQSKIYSQYGFDSHVGYGTAAHVAAIQKHGICPMHRRNFRIRGTELNSGP